MLYSVQSLVSTANLRLIRDVAHHRSVSKAARLNHLSQSAASQAIAELERELQVILFDRGRRPLEVTSAGKLYLEYCKDVLRRDDEWPPGVVAFENLVGDFWYHAVWSARKLRRGELWVALMCVDGYMKRLLLAVMAWRARAGAGTGEPWVEGRLLERWAESEALAALGEIFARYDAVEIAAALRGTMDLFRRLATDLSVRLELPYPARADDAATRLVGELLPLPRH